MFFSEGLELNGDVLEGQSPFLLQVVVLLQTTTHMPFVLLVVLRDLRLALLEDLDLEATLAWPLLAQVNVKLLN